MGDGVVYCRIINHYRPNAIPESRINHRPVSNYEATVNLKQVQVALRKMRMVVHLDIHKLARKTFADNWHFLQQLHKRLTSYKRLSEPL